MKHPKNCMSRRTMIDKPYVFGDTYFYNRVGVAIFVLAAHGKYMIGGVGGGVGWDNNVHARLRNYVMIR